MSLEPIDPIQFCSAQISALRSSVDALTTEVGRLVRVVEAMQSLYEDAADDAARMVLDRLSDTDHGRPAWQAGADHIGRRWWDTGMRKFGVAVAMLLVGAGISVMLIWYGGQAGPKP